MIVVMTVMLPINVEPAMVTPTLVYNVADDGEFLQSIALRMLFG